MRRWNGEDLDGKKILVWTDQGFGDTIQMLRFVPTIGRHEVSVCAEAGLLRLIEHFGYPTVRKGTPIVNEGWHVPLMSLPFIFKVTPEKIPASAYIPRAPWRGSALPEGFKVGICWSGMKVFFRDDLRSVTLDRLEPLLAVAGVTFVSLQKGDAQGQLAGRPVIDRMDECQDMLDTAALISQLDLVVSVDTSVAHLAGALGVPVWLMNRHESEWRWSARWYDSMQIFRQEKVNDWTPVVARMAAKLERMVTCEIPA